MKRILQFMLLVSLLATIPLSAQVSVRPPNTTTGVVANQVVAGFTGGAIWTSANSGICIWYFPVLGNLDITDLFALNNVAQPAIDRQHAYFIWVSDWKIQTTFQSGSGSGKVTVAVVPAGTGTIYYSPNPLNRDWTDPTQRATWGTPVATFTRSAAMFHSPDGFQFTDKFYFSATLVKNQTVVLRGKIVDFGDLMPHGMTCFEYGQQFSSTETGTCIAMGN
jgi:hypothetical protein